ERAERSGAEVVWGRAWEVAGAPAFGPWQQVLCALLPDARDLLAPSGACDPEVDLARRSAAVVDGLRQVAAERPLVLVFDALHAAAVASLALLQRVAHELRALRVLVVGTYREVEARRAAPVAALLARPSRATSTAA